MQYVIISLHKWNTLESYYGTHHSVTYPLTRTICETVFGIWLQGAHSDRGILLELVYSKWDFYWHNMFDNLLLPVTWCSEFVSGEKWNTGNLRLEDRFSKIDSHKPSIRVLHRACSSNSTSYLLELITVKNYEVTKEFC